MASLRASAVPLCLATAVAAVLALTPTRSTAATFVWGGGTGTWTTPGSWVPAVAPSGTNPTDVLTFGGSVGTPYTSTNNFGAPFRLNQIVLQATDSGTLSSHVIGAGVDSSIAFEGVAP